jgi:isopentenyldiphosphate isomerase
MKVPHDPDEIVAVVDDNDNIVGSATRKEVHEKGLLHREVFVYIINNSGSILLQLRKDNNKWDHTVGGHFPLSQSYLEAAIRETKEELGLEIGKKDLLLIAKEKISNSFDDKTNYRFGATYLVRKDISISDLKIDYHEINEVKYFNLRQLQEMLNSSERLITRPSRMIIEKYFLKYLK